jgi:hypothetical protein
MKLISTPHRRRPDVSHPLHCLPEPIKGALGPLFLTSPHAALYSTAPRPYRPIAEASSSPLAPLHLRPVSALYCPFVRPVRITGVPSSFSPTHGELSSSAAPARLSRRHRRESTVDRSVARFTVP